MKNTIILTALSVFFLTACSRSDQDTNTLMADRPVQEVSQTFTPEQMEQMRSIMDDAVAKAVAEDRLKLLISGKLVFPNPDPTFVNGVPVVRVDQENTRYYMDQADDCYKVFCTKWGSNGQMPDTLNMEKIAPKLRYQDQDYLIYFSRPHYVLELECETQSFFISVLDPETGGQLEDLWFTIDHKQELEGRVSYTRFDKKTHIGTPIPEYGISTLRLTQLLKLVPDVLKHGEVVKA